jgi:hypothetical protein
MKQNLLKNKILFWLGLIHFIIFFLLFIYSFFNNAMVLGINSAIKPMKFALSIWLYSWTMALILNYIKAYQKVKIYSWLAVVCMGFEQTAITLQALRGEQSHFNTTNSFGIVLFTLMGVFILIITLWTAYMTYIFSKQKIDAINPAIVLSIQVGLVFFVLFSLFGGYISSLKGHTIGASDGRPGLWFLNWNTNYGDLRVAHFFGIHSLQLIPVFAITISKYLNNFKSLIAVKLFSFMYLLFILWTVVQGLLGLPFIKSNL